jgi:hypothetical protein
MHLLVWGIFVGLLLVPLRLAAISFRVPFVKAVMAVMAVVFFAGVGVPKAPASVIDQNMVDAEDVGVTYVIRIKLVGFEPRTLGMINMPVLRDFRPIGGRYTPQAIVVAHGPNRGRIRTPNPGHVVADFAVTVHLCVGATSGAMVIPAFGIQQTCGVLVLGLI